MNILYIELLLRVLVAHFLADFVFQSNKMAKSKDESGMKSGYFWLHNAIHVLILALLVWDYHHWPVWLSISLGHLVIDALKKFFRKPSVGVFIIDQLVHIILIVGV